MTSEDSEYRPFTEAEEAEMERTTLKDKEGYDEYLEYATYLHNRKAALGETVEFKVILVAKPEPYVYWQFNGQTIEENDEKFVVSSKNNHHMLTVKKMSADTVGKIEIVAGNSVGVSSFQAMLELKE